MRRLDRRHRNIPLRSTRFARMNSIALVVARGAAPIAIHNGSVTCLLER